MSNEQPGKRKSKRLAGSSTWDEQDGDFHFTRASKRPKTAQSADELDATPPAPPPKKTSRAKSAKERPAPVVEPEPAPKPAPKPAKKAATSASNGRRRASKAIPEVEPSPEEIQPAPPKRTTRTSTRRSAVIPEEEPPAPKPAPKPASKPARSKRKREQAEAPLPTVNDAEEEGVAETPQAADVSIGPAKITLPVSDTPVINRNKEMRKKGGGTRRSSLGMRGRRASSLIDSGHNAIPHHQVATSEFYKHISAEGLSEPRRMRQLLTWCGERALLAKPQHGSENANVVNGARAIQDQLLKEFANRSECSDWFARDDEVVPERKAPVVLEENPRNKEHREKIEQLEAKVKRLREEKKAWLALKNRQVPELPPLFPDSPSEPGHPPAPALPDLKSLDANETQMLSFLTDPSTSFESTRRETQARLSNVQSALEFKIDQLADAVHKLLQRVDTAGREADKVLSLSSSRLKERENRERTAAGTREMPTMEVLRSLGRILPEGGG